MCARVWVVAAAAVTLMTGCDASGPAELDLEADRLSQVEVRIPDPALDAGVRRELAILRGSVDEAGVYRDPTGPLTADDLDDLRLLRIGQGVTRLDGLEWAVNLEHLSLPNNRVTDLSALSGLEKLERLDLSGNPLSEVEALPTLPRLEVLAVSRTGVDLSKVADQLHALRVLDLGSNEIADVTWLQGLVDLERLYLDGNEITDVSPLGALSNLDVLDLSSNEVANLSALGGIAAPTALILDDNRIADLSPLLTVPGWVGSHLSLRGNPLTASTLCEDLPGLEDRGVVIRGVDPCPTDPDSGAPEIPYLRTSRDILLAGVEGRGTLESTFTNRGSAHLYGNRCRTPPWGFQLRIEAHVEGQGWAVVHEPAVSLCQSPDTVAPGEAIEFVALSLSDELETGTYRIVWPYLWTGEPPTAELAPIESRTSAAFSIISSYH